MQILRDATFSPVHPGFSEWLRVTLVAPVRSNLQVTDWSLASLKHVQIIRREIARHLCKHDSRKPHPINCGIVHNIVPPQMFLITS